MWRQLRQLRSSRRAAAGFAAAAALAAAAGCGGGGGSTASADTGSQDGSLSAVQISPPPGATFISRSTRFYLRWDAQNPPPPSFTATLVRYKESCGDTGDQYCSDAQKTVLTRQGSGFAWEVKRKDDFTLDQGGIYYLQLDAGPEEILATYLVTSDGRAVQSPSLAAPAVRDAGAPGAFRHLVVTR